MSAALPDTFRTVDSAEYAQARDGVVIVERSARGELLLTGSEAAEFLQGQVTNDVVGLASGEGCYALLLTHKGKVRADMRVLRGSEGLRLDGEAVGWPALSRTVRTYSLGREVSSEDQTETRSVLSLLGPGARSVIDVPPPEREHAWVEGELGAYVATDLGVDVICRSEDVEQVRRALGVGEVSESLAECLRIESGRPRLGLELDEDTIPQEANLNERAVSFTKGCYVGQETVARLFYKGRPNRHLRGLALSEPVDAGDEVLAGGRNVGSVGSSCRSPAHGPIALAILRREAEPGDTVQVGPREASARVVAPPFAPTRA